jgi:hypothetical protein
MDEHGKHRQLVMSLARILVCLLLLGAAACGATAGPNSGELMFDFAQEDEDAGAADAADAGSGERPFDGGH